MSERPTGPKSLAEVFAQDISSRIELPIDPTDAYAFAVDVSKYRPPSGFFERVIGGLDYLNEEKFNEGMDNLARRVAEIVGAEPYIALVEDEHDSTMWVHNLLTARGVPPGRLVNLNALDGKTAPDWFQQNIPAGTKMLIANDFSIGAGTIDEIISAYDYSNEYATHVALLAISRRAEKVISSLTQNIQLSLPGRRIQSLSDILTNEDIAFIQHHDGEALREDALFWTWYKVPDNMPDFFTGTVGIAPLIRPEKFPKPY